MGYASPAALAPPCTGIHATALTDEQIPVDGTANMATSD